MAAAGAWRVLTTGRISSVSWAKNFNILYLCERRIASCSTFNHAFGGAKPVMQRIAPTPSSFLNNRLLFPYTKNICQAHFSTLNKQNKIKTPTKLASFANGVRFMPTLNQVRKMKPRTKKTKPRPYVPRSEKVLLGPQRKGVCIKVFIRKPKKPNSAQRKCALLKLSNGKTISAYIPREKGQLQEHGVVLFEGGRVQDCPGIKYKIIRGKLDMN